MFSNSSTMPLKGYILFRCILLVVMTHKVILIGPYFFFFCSCDIPRILEAEKCQFGPSLGLHGLSRGRRKAKAGLCCQSSLPGKKSHHRSQRTKFSSVQTISTNSCRIRDHCLYGKNHLVWSLITHPDHVISLTIWSGLVNQGGERLVQKILKNRMSTVEPHFSGIFGHQDFFRYIARISARLHV